MDETMRLMLIAEAVQDLPARRSGHGHAVILLHESTAGASSLPLGAPSWEQDEGGALSVQSCSGRAFWKW